MDSDVALRTTQNLAEANEWALVLAAAGIAYRVESVGDEWAVFVPEQSLARGRRALRAYDADTQPVARLPRPDATSRRTAWTVGVAAGASLLVWFLLIGPPAPGSWWFSRGAAASSAITNGEPWRAVTALTLHADLAHALGNAVAATVLLPFIVQRLGVGVGLALVVLAGGIGNVLGALAHGPQHLAIGASTATFGAVGILAALRVRTGGSGRHRWTVPVACVVLLAMLGAGQASDVLAHVLGLSVGAALGLVASVFRSPLPARAQPYVTAAVLLAIAASWLLALDGR
jgi:membrane associated rhomboid family serine protease